MPNHISTHAILETSHIGSEVTIAPLAVIGKDAQIGNSVVIQAHAVVGTGAVIEAGAFVGSHAVIQPGIRIGQNAQVAPFSLVVSDVPEGVTVSGQPAKLQVTIPGGIVHPNALVETTHIGEKTRIWAFCHVLPGARIGSDVNLCDHTFIESDVIIGDRVTVKCGVQLWDGLRVEDDVFIGPNATFTNDPFPRSKQYPEEFMKTILRKGASIGANATILPGVVIGEYAMVGAGAVVTKDVPPYTVVAGRQAQHVKSLPNQTASVTE